ncbi:dihydrolipoamide acetyltransferase family protein [Enterococcus italicus]|uniref:Dihydrolipoamide acetyltransferase component of pyruvate dehydrogenase complex n=1 Tax=Enterococcus italicus (strain DSM 15952 / CCUG 50447 / LMG 22039 / TP 1.5) TaxID=888064 RepID=E6LHP6_ENTI1|nr:dihydrolipoamide acetyltransferase family protein [Enterococcus italicus]EFU73301.1 2-oxo acid dehydrogenase acyltransferase (catalytic domain) [Enterococcus italicus DSM 15952]MDN6491757.1 2-oxo acid dehydrogenase subunit E2 [Leuconostoc sp.]OJG59461.1 branched-chain alpha-keto acid dehydrogenase subunit E2 [Enterococcus italicus DSM 15952]
MATEITMPKLGLTMTEGTVDNWAKKEGDAVAKGEVVCTISSEKLSYDVESPIDGTLIKILVAEGDDAECTAPIGLIGDAGEQVGETTTDATSSASLTAEWEAPETEVATPAPQAAPAPERKAGERIFITPLARKLAAEKGYDIAQINGSGGNGRITRRDVERHQPTAAPVAAAVAPSTVGAGLKGMRKTIAERMMHSLQTTAQVTIQQKADITNLLEFKKEIEAKSSVALKDGQLSITTLLSKAVILALKETPEMNAWYHDGAYEKQEAVHLGMAVAVADGLVVPVVENADRMTLTELGKTLNSRIAEARNGSLAGQHYTGSTFTISNLGKSGAEYFTPIINSPEIGILGVGSMQSQLAFDDNHEVVELKKLPLSLTFDHQIIDGSPAAEFLGRIIFYLENPYSLVF